MKQRLMLFSILCATLASGLLACNQNVTNPGGGGGDGTACTHVFETIQNISVPTTFANTASSCDYLVTGTLNLSSYLKIEPGVVIQFKQDATFYIEQGGQLEAVGTPTNRIRFVGVNDLKGFWNSVRFMAGSRESRLEYLDIRNAGQTGSAPWKYGSGIGGSGAITFKNNRVSGSYANGASFGNGLGLLEFSNNTFEDNLGYGLVIGYNQIAKLDKASDYAGKTKPNQRPYIYAQWGTDDFVENGTWPNVGVPYYISVALYVRADLTLEAGTKLVMEDGASIHVRAGGSLRAVGTAANPVVFEAERKTRGAWEGIDFFESSSPNNFFDHVNVLHAGSGVASLEVNGAFRGSSLSISNTTVAQGDGWGLCADDGKDTATEVVFGPGNDFSDNTSGGVKPSLGC